MIEDLFSSVLSSEKSQVLFFFAFLLSFLFQHFRRLFRIFLPFFRKKQLETHKFTSLKTRDWAQYGRRGKNEV